MDTGVVAPAWAMPAELLRQASRRLRLAALGLGLALALAIVLNNFIEAWGLGSFSHLALKNVIAGFVVMASTAMVWLAHSGRLTPVRLLRVSLGYEVAVAFAISMTDHLEPLRAGVPLDRISWLCLWIVSFPLMVPASPRWALLAGLASASSWPLAYLVGLATLGNPPVATHVLVLDSLENYFAAGVAMFSTIVIRRLQELGCSWKSWTTGAWARSGGRATACWPDRWRSSSSVPSSWGPSRRARPPPSWAASSARQRPPPRSILPTPSPCTTWGD